MRASQGGAAFSWWMLSNVGAGAATGSFLTLLLPPFITSVTGEPWRVGIVFAVLSLAAAVGPLVGAAVDRTATHRGVYTLSILAMALAYGLLAVDAAIEWYSPLFGLILGAAWATQGTIGPAFIVGVGDPPELTARRLTGFSLAYPAGVLLGALVVAGGLALGFEPVAFFVTCAVVLAGFAAATWFTSGAVSRRLAAASARPGPAKDDLPAASGTKAAPRGLRAAFVAFLVVVFVSSLGSNGLVSQLANIMPAVYGFSDVATALLVGLAGLLNVVTLVIAGRSMARTSSIGVFSTGTLVRAAGALAMALIGLATSPLLILAAVAMLVAYQGIPIPRLAAPDVAARLAAASPTRANGAYFASSAIGSTVGCVLAGVVAVEGYEGVLWVAALAGVAASVVAVLWLTPASRPAFAGERG